MARVSRLILISMTAVVALALAFWFALAPIIETVAVRQLAKLGVPDADLAVSEITPTHLTVEGVRLGRHGELEIHGLRMTFSWRDLLLGKVQSLNISGLILRATRTETGLSFGALDALFLGASGTGKGAVKWPVSTIHMDDSLIEIASPFGTTQLPVEGTLRQTDDGAVVLENTKIRFVHPNLSIDTTLQSRLEPDGTFTATLQIIRGTLDFGANLRADLGGGSFSLSGPITDLNALSGRGALTVVDARLPYGLTPRATFEVSLDDGTLKADFALNDDGHGVEGGLNVTLQDAFGGNPPMALALAFGLDDVTRLPADVGVPPGSGGGAILAFDLATDFDAFVRLTETRDRAKWLSSLPPMTLEVHANGLRLGQNALSQNLEASVERIRLTAQGGGQGLEGHADLSLRAHGTVPGGFSFSDATFSAMGSFMLGAEAFRFSPQACAPLVIHDGAGPGGVRLQAPLHLCLDADRGGPLVQSTWANGVEAGVDVHAALKVLDTAFALTRADGERFVVRGRTPTMRFNGHAPLGGGGVEANFTADGFDLVAASRQVAFNGVAARWAQAEDGGVPATFALSVAEIVDHHAPAYVAPLSLKIEGTRDASRLQAEGALQNKDGALKLGFDAEHDLNSGQGIAVVRLIPVTIGRKGKRISALSPVVAAMTMSADGVLFGAARIDWDGATFKADGDLLARGLHARTIAGAVPGVAGVGTVRAGQVAFKAHVEGDLDGAWQNRGEALVEKLYLQAAGIEAQNVNTVIVFDSLWPFTTPPGQEVSVGLIDIGLPLSDGLIAFTLGAEGALKLEQASFAWAGGKLAAQGIDAEAFKRGVPIALQVDGVQLDDLTRQLKVDGLRATGELFGTIPLVLKDDRLVIDGAQISAQEPGRITYRPAEGGGLMGGQVLLQAFSNFQYRTLDMALDGAVDGTLSAKISVAGSNPDYLEGYPVELTTTLTGRVGDILESGLASYQVPETIKKRMLDYGQ